jgi:FkbM family methyltransferase
VRLVKSIFPRIERYQINYPGFGICDIAFLDFFWIRQIFCGPQEELGLLERIQFLKPHYPVIWDVGANSGFIAVELMLRLNPDQLVLFEPNPTHERTLRSISSIDDRIRVIMTGLSDHQGTSVLNVPGAVNSGSSCASLDETVFGSCKKLQRVDVTIDTGDHLVESGTCAPPDLIIIDVEGHEASVLSGLSNTISKKQPIIIIEHLFLSDESILNLTPQNYSIYTINDKTGNITPKINREIGHNLLLLPVNSSIS